MVTTFGKLPGDPFFEEINPLERLWLYAAWCHDQEEQVKRAEHQAIFTGGFYNPELANMMLKREHPDFASSDEDFDAATRLVREQIEQETQEEGKRMSRRKRRKAQLIR